MATQKIQNPIVTLRNVRLSYPSIFTPKQGDNPKSKPKFSATFILDSITHKKEIAEMEAIIANARKSPVLGGKAPSKICLRKGDDTPERAEAEELGPTKRTISASSKTRPGIVDQQLQPVADTDEFAPYAGCYVNARVEVYPFVFKDDKTTVRLVCAGLINIQFVKDGEPFGAKRGPAEEGFEPVEAAADDGI